MRRIIFLILAVLVAAIAAAVLIPRVSNSKSAHAFYYWQTEWSAPPALLRTLAENKIEKLYMRFYDVEWDSAVNDSRPIAPIRFKSPPPANVEIVPVVYLVNEVFLKGAYGDAAVLADRVRQRVVAMAREHSIHYREVQVDCDWTDNSQRTYFHFVDLLARELKKEKVALSATIRLHQVKYVQRTGIPPADRGMLMFYNFGRIQAETPGNSIFNESDAAKYASYISAYPLALDVVLPIFSWSVHARDGEVLGLLESVANADASGFDGFRKESANRYTATRSFFFRGNYFRESDILLVEETTPDVTRQAAALAKRGAGWLKRYETVALFDLDTQNLQKYTPSDMRSILGQF